MKTLLGLALAACGFAACWALIGRPAAVPDRTFGESKVLLHIADKALDESSGVARSHRFPGRYYTHNDSGDTARFWRFDLSGKLEGPFNLVGATAVDWEDAASAKIGGVSYVYFGDIGDNAERRPSIRVYRVPEPVETKGNVPTYEVFDLTYPDGPHNAETLLVHPESGEIEIVTKAESGESLVFALPGSAKPGKHRLELVGAVKFPLSLPGSQLCTGGDVSEDGRHVILRTYMAAFEYDVSSAFRGWIKAKPRGVRLALEPQGEAIAYSLDGKAIVTTSEHTPCQVSTVSIKG